jgi:hypothetical protein
MKVKEIIKTLKTLNPEEHIVIQWYSKEDSDNWFANDKSATLKQWEEVVERCDSQAYEHFGDDISEQLQEVMEEDDDE